MLEEAKKRIKNDDIDFGKLMYDKFIIFLGNDDQAVKYADPIMDHKVRYTIISNVFYYFLLVTSLFGALVAIKNKNKSSLLIICLYVIGLTMAQMIVEVAPRYHYSATIPMIFLAAFGIKHIYNKKRI